jgi:hypothetical protein
MRKALVGLLIAAALAAAAAAALPRLLLGGPELRAAVLGALSSATGLPVRADGEVRLSGFPLPTVRAEGLTIGDPSGTHLRVPAAVVSPSLGHALGGRLRAGGLELLGPELVVGPAGTAEARRALADALAPPLARLAVSDGRVVRDGRTVLSGLAFDARVEEAAGGVRLSGPVGTGGLSATATLARAGRPGRQPVSAELSGEGVAVGFDGALSDGPTGLSAAGRLRVSASGREALAAVAGPAALELPPGSFALDADAAADADAVRLSGIDARAGDRELSGDLALRAGAAGSLSGTVNVGRLPLAEAARLGGALLGAAEAGRAVDLRVFAAGLGWRGIDAGLAEIQLRADAAGASVRLADTAVLDGTVAAELAVSRGPVPTATLDVRVNAVEAERLGIAVAGAPVAAGRLRGQASLAGAWPAAFLRPEGLAGTGAASLSGGRLAAGLLGVPEPIPLEALETRFALADGAVRFESVRAEGGGRTVFGQGVWDVAGGRVALGFAPAGVAGGAAAPAAGPLPEGPFRIVGRVGDLRIETGAPPTASPPTASPPTAAPPTAAPVPQPAPVPSPAPVPRAPPAPPPPPAAPSRAPDPPRVVAPPEPAAAPAPAPAPTPPPAPAPAAASPPAPAPAPAPPPAPAPAPAPAAAPAPAPLAAPAAPPTAEPTTAPGPGPASVPPPPPERAREPAPVPTAAQPGDAGSGPVWTTVPQSGREPADLLPVPPRPAAGGPPEAGPALRREPQSRPGEAPDALRRILGN